MAWTQELKKSKKGAIDEDKYKLEIERLKTQAKKVEGIQTSIRSFPKRKVVDFGDWLLYWADILQAPLHPSGIAS